MDDAQYNLGICKMQQGEYEAAIEAFTALIGDGETEAEPAEGEATEEQPEKQDSARVVTPSGMLTYSRTLQFSKA